MRPSRPIGLGSNVKEGLTDFGPLTDIGWGKEGKAVGEMLKWPLH